MTTLIPAESEFALWGILFGLAAMGFWVDTTGIGKRISGVGAVMILAIALSNMRIIPMSAPAYDTIFTYLVPAAIPLLLFKANLRRIIPETGGMLLAYLLGVIGTLSGVALGFYFLPLGEWGPQLSGAMAATYIGGSMNFVAVGNMLEIEETVLAAGIAADNVAGVTYLVMLAIMPTILILRKWLPSEIADRAESANSEKVSGFTDGATINLTHIAFGLSLSLIICAIGMLSAQKLGIHNYAILFITAITVLVANVFHNQLEKLTGHLEVGMLLMYVFFIVIGCAADIRAMIDSALWVFLFAIITLVCHASTILLGSKLFKLDLAEVVIASNACAAGPSTAAALAASKGWYELVTPGVLCGTLGYVIASFLGVFIAGLLG